MKNEPTLMEDTRALVRAGLSVNNSFVNLFLGLKFLPAHLQNLLKLLETNPRQFSLLALHVLLVLLAELHFSILIQ